MPNYLTASHDIADWCAARKLNDVVVKHWIKAGRAVDELTIAGIPRADIAELGPAAKTFLAHHLPPKECRETWPTVPPTAPEADTTQAARSASPTGNPGQGDRSERFMSDAAWARAKADCEAKQAAAAEERLARVRAGLPAIAAPAEPSKGLIAMDPNDTAYMRSQRDKPDAAAAWASVIAKLNGDGR